MSLCSYNYTQPNIRLFNVKPDDRFFFPKNPLQIRQFRVHRRRRSKLNRKFLIKNQLGPFDPNLFHSLVSQFPSANSLEFIAPTLGLVSGVALFVSLLSSGKVSDVSDVGEWIMFTSPTPFNRFVLLRCPSISFEGTELLEDVNEKLVKEDKHYVRLNNGRILIRNGVNDDLVEKLEYQRECVSTDDGGVISLDWPANLDLREEHGLDTTLLLVPGSAQGSLDWNVRSFVCEALKRGCFPVVMNPRGCAGSPLTTARLFTAADSDDISTSIQFINKERPWTTLMAVGWGFGANMLTKYLAEVGERTPLTAVTCIDNPFDLEEATRFSPHYTAIGQKLIDGLIDILRSNKELFLGRAKGFDVEKALSAKSVRDFENAISMVSYGFKTIEDFYSKSSTIGVVRNVKIPVLFIQNNDGSAPLFSIPRSSIAENPFTSLLLCSSLPSSGIYGGNSTIPWCQQLTIEWLTSVELGILKGRHPLLKDVDITFNPSIGMALLEGRASSKDVRVSKLLDVTQSRDSNGYSAEPTNDILEENDTSLRSKSRKDLKRKLEVEDTGTQEVENGAVKQIDSVDTELIKDDEVSAKDGERGQVLQTAEVVMNMLDTTMPGTLTEEKKKKVLTAVGKGETLRKALQDAVPDDVREKLTTAVSGILHAQGTNLKINELLGARIADMSTGLKSKIQENVKETSNTEDFSQHHHSSEQMKKADDVLDSNVNNQSGIEKLSEGVGSESHQSERSQKPVNSGHSQLMNIHGEDISSTIMNETGDSEKTDKDDFSREKGPPNPDSIEKGLETIKKPNSSNHDEKAPDDGEAIVAERKEQKIAQADTKEDKSTNNEDESVHDQTKMTSHNTAGEAVSPSASSSEAQPIEKGGEAIVEERKEQKIVQVDTKEDNNTNNEDESVHDQTKMTSHTTAGEGVSPSASSSEAQPIEKENNDNEKRDNKSSQLLPDQAKPHSDSNSPKFNVSQALDALTGMDDSTQVAVNSVFGVLENMISQLEKGSDDGNEVKDNEIDSTSRPVSSNDQLENSEAPEIDKNGQSGKLIENAMDPEPDESNESIENIPPENPISLNANSVHSSQERYTAKLVNNDSNKTEDHLTGSNLAVNDSDRVEQVNGSPEYLTPNPYRGTLYKEYFHKCLLSKMPRKSLDLDTTTALWLDYFPEDGQWKLLDLPGSTGNNTSSNLGGKVQSQSPTNSDDSDKDIEPLYVILDSEMQQEPEEYEPNNNGEEEVEIHGNRPEEVMHFLKNMILDSLKVEVGRRLSTDNARELGPNLARDMEQVANAVSLSILHDMKHSQFSEVKYHTVDFTMEKVGTLHGEHIIRAISSAVQKTSSLKRLVPVGVIVGSSLAALRKKINVAMVHGEASNFDQVVKPTENDSGEVSASVSHQTSTEKSVKNGRFDISIRSKGENTESNNLNNENVMVGAVTAALGASALLVGHQDPYKHGEAAVGSSKPLKMRGNNSNEPDKLEEASDKNQNNIVASLAEKAMSVASPVVPTTEGGALDQERLLAMLADLGQRGGILRLVGKVALLWGGLRGAMSLTDKLILFLRLAERPLIQRILGFVSMVLVLWSPIAVPLLPTIVQSWTTKNPSRIAEYACIVGLYTAVMILVTLWGKRIRGYENSLEQYGLDLLSLPKIYNFLKGLIGGVMLVLSIQSLNALLGWVNLSLPFSPSSVDAMAWLKVCVKMLMVLGQGIITATSVALVEELLFRSWLPEEIAADLGFHQGIIISGLAFSLFQRTPWAIPGLWLLSLGLAGARNRTQGSLSFPIGLRSGIMASSFVLERGGFITYKPNFPIWVTGAHQFEPFSGVIGFAFSLLLAIVLYPRHPQQSKNSKKMTIEE